MNFLQRRRTMRIALRRTRQERSTTRRRAVLPTVAALGVAVASTFFLVTSAAA